MDKNTRQRFVKDIKLRNKVEILYRIRDGEIKEIVGYVTQIGPRKLKLNSSQPVSRFDLGQNLEYDRIVDYHSLVREEGK